MIALTICASYGKHPRQHAGVLFCCWRGSVARSIESVRRECLAGERSVASAIHGRIEDELQHDRQDRKGASLCQGA